jgi:hypothetical protein
MKILLLSLFLIFKIIPADYQKKDSYEISNKIVEYGNIQNNDSFDGYVRIFNKETMILEFEEIYDTGEYDIFTYLAIVDEESFIIICNIYFNYGNFSEDFYKETIVIKYDLSGNKTLVKKLDKKPSYIANHNYLLIVGYEDNEMIFDKDLKRIEKIDISNNYLGTFNYQFQGIAKVNEEEVKEIDLNYPGNYKIQIIDIDYFFEFDVTVNPEIKILGNKYKEGYLGDVSIFSFGELYLNNERYLIGTEVKKVGIHHLQILGVNDYHKELDFTILPYIEYNDGKEQKTFMDNSTFNTPIRIYSNAQLMMIDGEIYDSSIISKTGEFDLLLMGINNFQVKLKFIIAPTVQGVEDGVSYKSAKINVFGQALLNGSIVSGQFELKEPGTYKLELMLDEEVYKVINFTITSNTSEEPENISWFQEYFEYLFLIISIVGVVLILRKK